MLEMNEQNKIDALEDETIFRGNDGLVYIKRSGGVLGIGSAGWKNVDDFGGIDEVICNLESTLHEKLIDSASKFYWDTVNDATNLIPYAWLFKGGRLVIISELSGCSKKLKELLSDVTIERFMCNTDLLHCDFDFKVGDRGSVFRTFRDDDSYEKRHEESK